MEWIRHDPMAGACEQDNKALDSINGMKLQFRFKALVTEFIRKFIKQVSVSVTLKCRIREVPNSNLVELLAK